VIKIIILCFFVVYLLKWLAVAPGSFRGTQFMVDMFTTQEHPPECLASDFIWHKQVPLKVFIFAWRLLRDRLPTKVNLARCSIIPIVDWFCVAGCGLEKDVQHLFLLCSTFGTLWQLVRSLISFDGANSQVITDHFQQFIYYTYGLKLRRYFLQLIWLLCA